MPHLQVILIGSLVLLSVAALCGFAQYTARHDAQSFARWRVVHAGGTGAAVQLLVLVVLAKFFGNQHSLWVLSLVGVSSWAFFLGPLAKALGRPRLGGRINGLGSFFAVPGYLGLPFVFSFL